MFVVNQFSIPVVFTGVAATNDANAATGIAAGGPYNGAITAVTAAGAPTPIAAGDGVLALVTEKATFIPFSVTSNYYNITLQAGTPLAAKPNIMALTHHNLHISPYEYVLDYKLTCVENVGAPNNILPSSIPVVNYNRANQTFFITIPTAASAVFNANVSLILQVVFGRQN